jgi:hypothetical protein
MAIDKETERAILILLGVSILSKLGSALQNAGTALQQGGAQLYEVLHPDEANHANDLPGKQLPREAVLAIATLAGFPDPKLAAAIAMAESGGVPNAIARSSREFSVGLWQINTKVHPYTPAQMAEPMQNAAAAFKISKGGTSWKPWGAFTNGSYKKFQTGILA